MTTSRTNRKRVKRAASQHARFTFIVLPIPRGGPKPQMSYGHEQKAKLIFFFNYNLSVIVSAVETLKIILIF